MSSPNDTNLAETLQLEILQAYKRRFSPADQDTNHTPFDENSIIRYDDFVDGFDVPDIHRETRHRIRSVIEGIHQGRPSQVILLSGNPGVGKTHLINFFRPFPFAQELGYVFVRSSNHWNLKDFESCLLEWVVNSLCEPAIDHQHLLLDKIEDVAFQALGMLLDTPGAIENYKSQSLRGFLSNSWAKLTGRQRTRFRRGVDQRDKGVFRLLDFVAFSDYVCQQFLYSPNNDFHCYVMHVLLRYLFKDERPLIRAWLKGEKVEKQFLKQFGAYRKLDRKDKQFEVLKILVSLFTPSVCNKLNGPNGKPRRDLVFFFAFDQAETRNAMFVSDEEWKLFFAHLSELYNALPNVLIVFTMTIGLRDEHLANMEGQFRDRIRQDPVFILKDISQEEAENLYHNRIQHWLGEESGQVLAKLNQLQAPFLPLTRGEVAELSRTSTLRQMVRNFDARFRQRLLEFAIDVPTDFQTYVKELFPVETETEVHTYTGNHLQTVEELFAPTGSQVSSIPSIGVELAGKLGMLYQGHEIWKTESTATPALRFQFADANHPNRWIRVFLVKLGWFYRKETEECVALLTGTEHIRYHLWVVRAHLIEDYFVSKREGKMFARVLAGETETELQAANAVWRQQGSYKPESWARGKPWLLDRVEKTYLGELLQKAREGLDLILQATGTVPTEAQQEVGQIPEN